MTLIERMDMKLFPATTLSLCMIALAPAEANQSGAAPGANAAPNQAAQAVSIARSGSQPSVKGPAEYFTRTVRIDSPFQASIPARIGGGTVTFEPGARTAWHTHPLGQTLIVTTGCGWVQREGGPVEEIRPGDVVWSEPGEKHWHGATAATAMSHIAIQEKLNGSPVDWLEHVTDEQYGG